MEMKRETWLLVERSVWQNRFDGFTLQAKQSNPIQSNPIQSNAGNTSLTNMLVLVRGSSAKTVKARLVSFVISVREIETSDAQARVDEGLEHGDIPASRSKGADDLGSTGGGVSRLGDGLQRNVGPAKFRSVSSRHFYFGMLRIKKEGEGLRDEFFYCGCESLLSKSGNKFCAFVSSAKAMLTEPRRFVGWLQVYKKMRRRCEPAKQSVYPSAAME
jgi:hypothetical protein